MRRMKAPSARRRSRGLGSRWIAFIILALAVLAALIYGPFYDSPLSMEDINYLFYYSPTIHMSPIEIVAYEPAITFRPLYWMVAAVLFNFFKLEPTGYFFVGVSLHIINATLVGVLAFRIFRNTPYAALSSIIFFVSNLTSGAVVYRAAHLHLFGGFWFLVALLAYIHYRKTGRPRDFLVSLALFFMAAFTDQATVSLVFICLVYDLLYPPGGVSFTRNLAYSCLRVSAFGTLVGLNLAISLYRGLEARYSIGLHIIKNIAVMFSHPWYVFGSQGIIETHRESPTVLSFVSGLLAAPNRITILAMLACIVVTAAVLIWRALRGARPEQFGCLFYLLSFIPFFHYVHFNKRHFYIPMIGLSIVLAYWFIRIWGVKGYPQLFHHRSRTAVLAGVSLLLAAWGVHQVSATRQLARFHRNEGRVASQMVQSLERLSPPARVIRVYINPKGLPKDYVFKDHLFWVEPFLRSRWAAPSLKVHWVGEDKPLPPPEEGTLSLVYRGGGFVEHKRNGGGSASLERWPPGRP